MTSATRRPMHLLAALIAIVALAAAAMAPAAQADGRWNKNRNASLTLVHGIPGDSVGATRDLPVQVRVYRLFDGTKVFDGVTFPTVVGPLSVKPGIYRIQVRVTGTPLVLTRWTYISPGENVSAVAYLTDSGRLGNPSGKPAPQLGIFTNDVSSSPGAGKARVIVRHLADAPAVDVLAGGGTLINALANPGSAAGVVPAGTYPIQVVADADNTISAFGPADLTFAAGTTTQAVYAVGSFYRRIVRAAGADVPQFVAPVRRDRRRASRSEGAGLTARPLPSGRSGVSPTRRGSAGSARRSRSRRTSWSRPGRAGVLR